MKKILQGICIAGALCTAGCLTTVDTVENHEKTYVANEVIRRHVETDASQPIKVTNLIDRFAANGFLQIAFEFTNTSSSPRTALYQLEWFDQDGMTVPTSLTQWTEIRLNGRDSRQVTFTAPNARARSAAQPPETAQSRASPARHTPPRILDGRCETNPRHGQSRRRKPAAQGKSPTKSTLRQAGYPPHVRG